MKANRKFLTNDSAEVGVGTLIVFIAMVLVAAVAAAVIIGTSGTLQQRAQQTGKEATEEVSSNLKVLAIYGERNLSSTDVYNISLHVELSAGAVDHDLTRVIIRYSDGNTTRNYNHSTQSTLQTTSGSVFVPTWIRGQGVSDVMKSGDLVEIKFNLIGDTLPVRTDVQLMLIPEVGTPVLADFNGPSTYGVYKTVTLRN